MKKKETKNNNRRVFKHPQESEYYDLVQQNLILMYPLFGRL